MTLQPQPNALAALIAAAMTFGCGARSSLELPPYADRPDTGTEETEPPLPDVQLASGRDHTCYLRDGRAWCWGTAAQGQLGLGVQEVVAKPTPVPLTNLRQVACGEVSSIFLTRDGVFYYVGPNEVDGTGRTLLSEPTKLGEQVRHFFSMGAGQHHVTAAPRPVLPWSRSRAHLQGHDGKGIDRAGVGGASAGVASGRR